MMDLSIIIVNWNTKDLLMNCLSTVYNKVEDIRYQVIVVDNASTDGSQQMVKDLFPSVFLIENEMNLGFACANNIALSVAKGRHILLLNSDTLVLDSVIQKSVQYLDQTPHCWAMGCQVLNDDCTIQPSASRFPSFLNLAIQTLGFDKLNIPFFQRYRKLISKHQAATAVETISGCYLMAKKDAFNTIGLLDESFFFFGEETDWCERVRKTGFEVHYAPVGKIIHFGGGSSRPLQYRRDILLTQATVRLHRKHKGLLASLFVYFLLLSFNLSRWMFWTLSAMLTTKPANQARQRHFQNVCLNYLKAWPSKKGGLTHG
ncbi:glycosyltransferase family 2 protein [Temperatibacter marinus]|uniref:Glycosyltransferase family 2 protein n=1 Tax=Temperatibacter marinus TaxID=1456591 RepID=A0AA52EIS6_9PROT|nr:glycosyltransferase family 2 protein [Temperatibacter marinus]WND03274.1 glycosyltransferase family 2 protein [Temperatibacter marinus]